MDGKLSPYVPEWLLAWGANINIQYCSSAHFLSYIAKYISKIEPYAMISDSQDLQDRDNQISSGERYLQARCVGAPEAVFRCFGHVMHRGNAVTKLITKLPHLRQRAIKPKNPDLPDNYEDNLFRDSVLEQYMNRPDDVDILITRTGSLKQIKRQDGSTYELHDFNDLLYPKRNMRFWDLS